MDTVTSNSVIYKMIRSESEDAKKIDATYKINGINEK